MKSRTYIVVVSFQRRPSCILLGTASSCLYRGKTILLHLFCRLRALILEGMPVVRLPCMTKSMVFGGPVKLVIVGPWLNLDYLQLRTAELTQEQLLRIELIPEGLLLHDLIYFGTLLFSIEVMEYPLQPLLFLPQHLLLLNHHIRRLGGEGLKTHLLYVLPAEEMHLVADPVLHVVLVYFLEAGTNGGLPCLNLLYISAQHLLQLILFEKTKHPFLLVGVQQNALPVELVIIEFPNVGVPVRESPLSEVPEPIAPVEATLHALQLQGAAQIIIVLIVDLQLEPQTLQVESVVHIAKHEFLRLLQHLNAIYCFQVHFEGALMSRIEKTTQLLTLYHLDDVSIRLHYLLHDSAIVEKNMIDLQTLIINHHPVSVWQGFPLYKRQFDEALSRANSYLSDIILQYEHRHDAVLPKDDVMPHHIIEAILRDHRSALIDQHYTAPVLFIRSHPSHVNGIIVVHIHSLRLYSSIVWRCYRSCIGLFLRFRRTQALTGKAHTSAIKINTIFTKLFRIISINSMYYQQMTPQFYQNISKNNQNFLLVES